MSDSDQTNHTERPAGKLEVDFALVIARLIETAKYDPVQLRNSIYELARWKLQDQLAYEHSRERRQMVEALETAIKGVEAFSQRQETVKLASTSAPADRDPPSRELMV